MEKKRFDALPCAKVEVFVLFASAEKKGGGNLVLTHNNNNYGFKSDSS